MRTDRAKRGLASGDLADRLKAKGRLRREGLAKLTAAGSPALGARNDHLPPSEVTYLPVGDIHASPRRIRKLDPAHICEIAASVSELGFCAPILIGIDGEVVDGESRLEAAKQLGLDRVPCIRIQHLSKAEIRVLRLAVNRLAEKGQWNLDELKIEFEELIILDAPLAASGFTLDEIDHISLGDEADAVELGPLAPKIGAIEVARLGDVYRLGRHRVICGDATDPRVLTRVMQEMLKGELRWVQLIFTDEPYNRVIGGNVTRGDHREFPMASGEMKDEEFLAFNIAWMKAVLPFLVDGGVLGTFNDWRGQPFVQEAAGRLGLVLLNLIVWNKPNAGMGSLYRSKHELLPLFKKGDERNVNNVNLGKRGRWRSNVWEYPGASSFGSDARRGLQDHPTVKPTAMLKDALLDLTNRDDIVIDPFLGSGSTLMAAEATGRICGGVELDPLYVDVIIRRYEAATGAKAVLLDTGETFAEVAARRASEAEATSASTAALSS